MIKGAKPQTMIKGAKPFFAAHVGTLNNALRRAASWRFWGLRAPRVSSSKYWHPYLFGDVERTTERIKDAKFLFGTLGTLNQRVWETTPLREVGEKPTPRLPLPGHAILSTTLQVTI